MAGSVPEALNGVRVLRLELDPLFSDKSKSAERFAAIIEELAASKKDSILFVNELSKFVGSDQISPVLADNLLSGKIRIIGGASTEEYAASIENVAEVAAMFETITIGDRSKSANESTLGFNADGFRGDNVSADLREMMQNDPTGKGRVDVIVQAKDADDPSLRALLSSSLCPSLGGHIDGEEELAAA